MGNHLPVVQILLSKFGKHLNVSIRNDEGFNPLDLAVVHRRKAIVKVLLRNAKPEMSSLVQAVECDQHELVSQFSQALKKPLNRYPELNIYLQRFIDLSKELDLKSTTKERREECKTNLDVYRKNICAQLRKNYSTHYPKVQDSIPAEPDLDSNKDELDLIKEILSEFDCPVCFELMSLPKRIYSCSNDHFICSLCLTDPRMFQCPQCTEDFKTVKPNIRHTSERCLTKLLEKQ